MTVRAAIAMLGAAGCAAGLLLLVGLLSGWVRPGPLAVGARGRVRSLGGLRTSVGLALGVVVLVATGWVAIAVGAALAVVLWPALFGTAGQQQNRIDQLEAVASWVESLRDTLQQGRGLPEVIAATTGQAPPVLRRPLQDLVARMQAREPLEQALLVLADDLDDPVADQVVGALALSAQSGGGHLPMVLGALATSTRRQVDVRRQVEAERAGPRRGVKIVVVVTVLLVVGFAVLSPSYMRPFSSLTGQCVLAVAVGCFAAGFVGLRALATFHAPARFLATPGVGRQNEAAPVAPSVARTVLGSVAVRG